MQDKIGLIGQNGTGKTTLLQMLIGSQGVDEGTVSRKKGCRLVIFHRKWKMAQSLLLTMCIKASKTSKNCKHNSITMKKNVYRNGRSGPYHESIWRLAATI
ncbi:ATP-binding cassette domain-containing protein [Enterococcus mundtii]|nr:ATP-binding cassette domain-containing protein [Enterococcus mundtii]